MAATPAPERGFGRLLVRTVSAAVGIVLVLAAVWAGRWPVAVLIAVVAGLATSELVRMLRTSGAGRPSEVVSVAVAVALPLAAAWAGPRGQIATLAIGMAAALAWLLAVSTVRTTDAALTVLAYTYASFLLSFLVLIERIPAFGRGLLLLTLVTTWVSDSTAYFVGVTMGRHKLAPNVSPNKTWEGTVGGFVLTVALVALAAWVAAPTVFAGMGSVTLTWPGTLTVEGATAAARGWLAIRAALIAAVVVISGTVGDLVESRIKREVGVKDTGGLIPGHGGMLDRFDSLLFVAPATYAVFRLLTLP